MASVQLNIVQENPNKKPIDELFFAIKENGISVKIPALSSHWITNRTHTEYKPLPITNGQLDESVALNEWFNVSEIYLTEINWLLSLEHFRFWSSMVHDSGCIVSVISFLQEAIPFYTPITSLTDNERVLRIYQKIHQCILKIICRMVTNRESETEWITKEHLAKLLYSKFLLSIPMLFDIIVAYGRSNVNILIHLCKTLFTIEPKYKDDLIQSMECCKKVFNMIQATINENNNSQTMFNDLCLYTLDCAASINILLEIYPDAIEMALKIKLQRSITHFYDTTIPLLYNHIFLIDAEAPCLKFLSQARIELLGSFRCMSNYYLEKMLSNPKDCILLSENFLEMLHETLEDHLFVIDYQRTYPILNDIDILYQVCRDLDNFKIDFIIEAYTAEEKLITKSKNINEFPEENVQNPNSEHDIPCTSGYTNSHNSSCSNDKQIQHVLDILPDLKIDFIIKLLERYENSELAITAVLEGNLAPDLAELQNSHLICDETLTLNNVVNELMETNNTNVIVKYGKTTPGEPSTFDALLNDKSHVKELKKRFELLGLVSENEYDDEYDDSYEAMADSESKSINALRKTGANNYVADEISDSDDDDDNDDSNDENQQEESTRDRNRDFCENPEIVRARLAESRNSKFAARNKNIPSKSFNTVGTPKSQDKDTKATRERHMKDVHKSSRANHNRRQGASWKRSRGMLPS